MSVSNSTIAEYLDVEQKQIIKRRDAGDSVIVLVDEGIGGIKKHTISLAALAVVVKPKQAKPKEEAPEVEPAAEPFDDNIYEGYTVSELQAEAKERGISYSGLRKAELIEALTDD